MLWCAALGLPQPCAMTTHTTPREAWGLRKPALTGFALGFAMAFVATVLALMFSFFEGAVHDVLVPGAWMLSGLRDVVADWNGLLSMTLVALVNGAVYAAVFALVAATTRGVRQR